MDKMTPEQLKQKLDELLDEEYFPPVAVTRGGEPRIVVLPFVAYQSMRNAARRVVRTEDMTEEDIRAIESAKMPEGYEHLNDLLKED